MKTPRLFATLAILAAMAAFVAGTTVAGAGRTPQAQPAGADLPLFSPEEFLAWCSTHNTAGFRARLNTDGKTFIRGCDNVADVVASMTPTPSPTSSPTSPPTVGPTTPAPTLPPTSAPPTTVAPTPSPSSSPTPSPTPTADPGCTGQANPACTGVPAGWVPVITHTGDLTITQAGSTWTDVRVINGSIFVLAANVHLTRVEVTGGIVYNEANGTCYNGLTLDQVSVIQGSTYSNLGLNGVVGPGGYTARRVEIESRVEGFRAGGKSMGCTTTTLIDSYAHVTPPRPCPGTDWHGDGVQVFDGALDARNVTAWLDEVGGCGGTSAYFQAGAEFNNSPPTIDGMLVRGGGYPFRLLMPGSVRNLHVVDGSWSFEPFDRDMPCAQMTPWQADVVTIDANWQITSTVRPLPC